MDRTARTDHPVQEPIARRWSPYEYADQDVSGEDLRSIFEAARWSASSYNEQPWRYIVGRKSADGDLYQKVLDCLVEPNQAWARFAPVLALGIVSNRFSRNDKPNRVALHDLGLASAQLTLEASARGLVVHQMGGILPEKVAETFGLPEGYEAFTALAIGVHGENPDLPDDVRQRDRGERVRKPLGEIAFGEEWGSPHPSWVEAVRG